MKVGIQLNTIAYYSADGIDVVPKHLPLLMVCDFITVSSKYWLRKLIDGFVVLTNYRRMLLLTSVRFLGIVIVIPNIVRSSFTTAITPNT